MKTPSRSSADQAAGFTLIETVVTLAIIGIVTVIVVAAFPVVRTQQALLLAQVRLEALLKEAQQLALNEDRAAECVSEFPGNDTTASTKRRRCSDVGLFIQGRTATLFADTDGSKSYTAGEDYTIREAETLSAASTTPYHFVAIGTPPQLALYGNGALLDDQHPAQLTLVIDQATLPLTISSFGKIEQR